MGVGDGLWASITERCEKAPPSRPPALQPWEKQASAARVAAGGLAQPQVTAGGATKVWCLLLPLRCRLDEDTCPAFLRDHLMLWGCPLLRSPRFARVSKAKSTLGTPARSPSQEGEVGFSPAQRGPPYTSVIKQKTCVGQGYPVMSPSLCLGTRTWDNQGSGTAEQPCCRPSCWAEGWRKPEMAKSRVATIMEPGPWHAGAGPTPTNPAVPPSILLGGRAGTMR